MKFVIFEDITVKMLLLTLIFTNLANLDFMSQPYI